MNDADRKLLTRMIGKCWHKWDYYELSCDGSLTWFRCRYCHSTVTEKYQNSTFTTPDDMIAVKEAIEKAGRWSQFEDFTFWEWQKIPLTEMTTHMQWLIDPERFCALAAEWAKKGGGRDESLPA